MNSNNPNSLHNLIVSLDTIINQFVCLLLGQLGSSNDEIVMFCTNLSEYANIVVFYVDAINSKYLLIFSITKK